MPKTTIVVVAAVLVLTLGTFGSMDRAFGVIPTLPVTDGLIYQLDASDPLHIAHDGSGNITSWASSQGTATGFSMAPVSGQSYISAPTYQAVGGDAAGLPCIKFVATSSPALAIQKLVQTAGGPTTPKCVFIMENSDSPPGTGLGGIWGPEGIDGGIAFWADNTAADEWGEASQPANTHQLVNYPIGTVPNWWYGVNIAGANGQAPNTNNYYWSDATIPDSQQTWQPKNWGTLGAYNYNATAVNSWSATSLGNYFHPSEGRAWSGQIGEVIAFDRYLTGAERQSVETYLANKWLVPEPATLSLLALGGLAAIRKRRK